MLVTDVEVFCGSSPITMTGVWLAPSKDPHPANPMRFSIKRASAIGYRSAIDFAQLPELTDLTTNWRID
jgi:hypothetical protein